MRGTYFNKNLLVAPPRGERGLKSDIDKDTLFMAESLPLVGSVD